MKIKQKNAKRFNDCGKGNRDCVAGTAKRLRFYMRNYMLNHRIYHDRNSIYFQGMICNKGFLLNIPVFFSKCMAVGSNFRKS